ncbi:MAG: M48 family metalloprotease [Proteobacteria bacterium]|nr:M48 family metalloprotease [Pseudomonadota bacterium]
MTAIIRIVSRNAFAIAAVAALCINATLVHAAGDGEKMYNELRESGGLYADEAWQEYVIEIGERLLAATPHAGQTYTFSVLDSSDVQAMATADAYVFVSRGIVAYLKNEDELAGIIGHEIGHVVGRHIHRSKSTQTMGTLLGWLGALATGSGSMIDLSNTLAATAAAGYGREHELEADAYGAEFLAKAGYDPLAMIDAIYVLKDHELFAKNIRNQPTVYHGLFGSHPRNDKRLHDVVAKAQPLATSETREPERDFWEMVDGLVYGDEASTGLIKDGVYYHSGLRIVIKFPDTWVVTNTPAEVLGRSPNGSKDASITAQRQEAPKSDQTPEEYISQTLKRDDVSSGEALTVNGYEAYIGEITVAGGDAQKRKIAIIYKDGGVYVLKGEVGPNGDPAVFDQSFRETVESFRAMTFEDLKVANNQRVKVIVASPEDTFAELAQRSSIKAYPEETLRVINGMHPRGEPRAGDNIKIVQ